MFFTERKAYILHRLLEREIEIELDHYGKKKETEKTGLERHRENNQ